jgi:hypothetical protein
MLCYAMFTVDFPVEFPVDVPVDFPVDVPSEIGRRVVPRCICGMGRMVWMRKARAYPHTHPPRFL